MTEITTDKLAEAGFSFIGHNVMVKDQILIDVYGKPFKMNNKPVHYMEELEQFEQSYQDKLSKKIKKK